MNKPIGFDNWRAFFFTSKNGSNPFWIKASFCVQEVDAGGVNRYRLYRGPNILTTSAEASATIATTEPHGFRDGDTVRIHGLPATHDVLNTSLVITAAPETPSIFTVAVATNVIGITAAVGMVGVDIGAAISVADWDMLPGRLCVEDYPAAWEMPWEG